MYIYLMESGDQSPFDHPGCQTVTPRKWHLTLLVEVVTDVGGSECHMATLPEWHSGILDCVG